MFASSKPSGPVLEVISTRSFRQPAAKWQQFCGQAVPYLAPPFCIYNLSLSFAVSMATHFISETFMSVLPCSKRPATLSLALVKLNSVLSSSSDIVGGLFGSMIRTIAAINITSISSAAPRKWDTSKNKALHRCAC